MAGKNKLRTFTAAAAAGILLTGLSAVSVGATSGPLEKAPNDNTRNTAPVAENTVKNEKPNVVIIYTDDQKNGSEKFMQAVQRRIVSAGVSYTNAHSATATCCPARVSLLTGKLAKDTNVWTNWLPFGGFEVFHKNGGENSTIATRLDAVGYRTALVGKYLNGYGESERATITGNERYIPPGWDVWHAFAYPKNSGKEKSSTSFFDYYLMNKTEKNQNASFQYFGTADSDYSTNVLASKAVSTIRSTPARQPLFLLYTPYGPHGPYETTKKYRGSSVPNPDYLPPGFGDTTGKPPWIVNQNKVRPESAKTIRARQIRSLYPIDDAVERIVSTLSETGRLQNTILVFASDNGYTWGEFNLLGSKNSPYTTAVPTAIRWDAGGFRGGVRDNRLVANIDITRTILAAAGADTTGMPDAINLADRQTTRDGLVTAAWRNRGPDASKLMPPYCGYRTSQWLYIRYDKNRFEELYRVSVDPNLLKNLAVGTQNTEVRNALNTMRALTKEKCSPTPPEFAWGADNPEPPPTGDKPNSPTVSWSALSTSSVRATWNTVTSATSYKCTASVGTPALSGTTCTVSGLQPNTTTVISVSACNSNGCSTPTSVSAVSQSGGTIPATPTVTWTALSSSAVRASWSTVTSATSYKCTSTAGTPALSGTTCTVSGLAPDATVTVSVSACNSNGCSAVRNTSAASNPVPPTSVSWSYLGQSVDGGNRSASISWSGGSASNYHIMANGNLAASVGSSPYTFATAAASTAYNFGVQVRNRVSGTIVATVNAANNPLPAAPASPSTLAAQPGKGTESPLSVPVTVTWGASNGATTYRLFRADAVWYWTLNGTSYADNGLVWNTNYSYKVMACGTYGCSAWSPSRVARTAPAPAFWSVSRSSGTSAAVNISGLPSGAAGLRIKWCDRTAAPSCNPDVAHTGQTNWFTSGGIKNVGNLTSGRQYAFQIISARGSAGEGPQTVSVIKTG